MICVALADLTFREILNILKQEEMAEIRIDLLDLSLDQIKQIFQSHTRLIATCRPGRYSDNERQTSL
ncbi:MAG: type I 3-dehydroquinate dehydratase, partial [Candidatus Marinimicrobia bacterium]|nr:type I 3-dehydroquinate dehydratase [Candidatus Neomarinimicrobiota bacterium]